MNLGSRVNARLHRRFLQQRRAEDIALISTPVISQNLGHKICEQVPSDFYEASALKRFGRLLVHFVHEVL
jgi:hypothetical protein